MSGAKVSNRELRVDEWTKFTLLENAEHEPKPKPLDEVTDVATEVNVWLDGVSSDPWYLSCTSCKKSCQDVCSKKQSCTNLKIVFSRSAMRAQDVARTPSPGCFC